MIEEQLSKIEKRMAELEAKQETTNGLLADILSAIRDGGLPPAPKMAAEEGDEKPKKVANASKSPKKVENAVPSIDDVRAALTTFKDANDRDATIELMQRYLPEGAKPVVSEIPTDKYGDILAEIAA